MVSIGLSGILFEPDKLNLSKVKITKDIKLKHSGGMFDLFDNHIKSTYNLTDDEYDFMADNMTEEEIDLFIISEPTFTQKREQINIRAKYLKQYNELA